MSAVEDENARLRDLVKAYRALHARRAETDPALRPVQCVSENPAGVSRELTDGHAGYHVHRHGDVRTSWGEW